MGRYLKEAKLCLEQIRYFYEHGGPYGYSQALPHYNDLGSLIGKAASSKNNKSEAIIIREMHNTATPLMQEMEKRQSAKQSR